MYGLSLNNIDIRTLLINERLHIHDFVDSEKLLCGKNWVFPLWKKRLTEAVAASCGVVG